MENSWTFNGDYCEAVTLADGNRLHIRPIRPDDQQKMAETFRRLSAESRYRRCFSLKKELTPAELHFFTHTDGVNHFALIAVSIDENGRECEGIGGTRFIRMGPEADVAEVAFLVSDGWQHKGIGRLLLQRLIAAAAERGISRMRCYLLAENSQARQFISTICWDVSFRNEGTLIAAEFAIGDVSAADPEKSDSGIFSLLDMAARGYAVTPAALACVASDYWWGEVKRTLELWNGADQSDAA